MIGQFPLSQQGEDRGGKGEGGRDCRERSRRDGLSCGSLKSQYLHGIHTKNVCSYLTVAPIIRILENGKLILQSLV